MKTVTVEVGMVDVNINAEALLGRYLEECKALDKLVELPWSGLTAIRVVESRDLEVRAPAGEIDELLKMKLKHYEDIRHQRAVIEVTVVLDDLRDLQTHSRNSTPAPSPEVKAIGRCTNCERPVPNIPNELIESGSGSWTCKCGDVGTKVKWGDDLTPAPASSVKEDLPLSLDKATLIIMGAAQDWANGHMTSKVFKDAAAEVFNAFIQPTTEED